jgi:hypothetical protein
MPRAAPVTIAVMFAGSGLARVLSVDDMLTFPSDKFSQPGRLNWIQATVLAATVV